MAVWGKIRRLRARGPWRELVSPPSSGGKAPLTSNRRKCSGVLRVPTPTLPGRLGHRIQGGPRTEPLRLKLTEEFRRWTGRVWEPQASKSAQAATPCAARRGRALLRLGAPAQAKRSPVLGTRQVSAGSTGRAIGDHTPGRGGSSCPAFKAERR